MTSFSYGQNCFCVSGTKDKEKGIETVGGVTNTRDYYSLLTQKIMNYRDTTEPNKYRFLYNVASKVLLSDSILNTTGTVELKLLDNTTILIDNVEYQNNPLGPCCTLGFWFYTTEEIIKNLSTNPIESISVKNILGPSIFTKKRQKEQMKIFKCLLIRKPKGQD